jgi:hypothetical protein
MAAYVEALWDYGESSVVTHGIQAGLIPFHLLKRERKSDHTYASGYPAVAWLYE